MGKLAFPCCRRAAAETGALLPSRPSSRIRNPRGKGGRGRRQISATTEGARSCWRKGAILEGALALTAPACQGVLLAQEEWGAQSTSLPHPLRGSPPSTQRLYPGVRLRPPRHLSRSEIIGSGVPRPYSTLSSTRNRVWSVSFCKYYFQRHARRGTGRPVPVHEMNEQERARGLSSLGLDTHRD